MSTIELIRSKFNKLEPIVEKDLLALGLSIEEIKDTLEEDVFEKVSLDLGYFDFGNVYVLPSYSAFLKRYIKTIDYRLLICNYFLGKDFEFGYYKGSCVLNTVNLSEQLFTEKLICSTRTEKELFFEICYTRIRVFPMSTTYSNKDAFNLMFSNALNHYRKFFDYDWKYEAKRLANNSLINKNILPMISDVIIRDEAKRIFTSY